MLVDEKVTCEGCKDFEKCEAEGATFTAKDINKYEYVALRALANFKVEEVPNVV